MLLSISREEGLRRNKLSCLEELAALDVDSALPPTDRTDSGRRACMAELASIEAAFDALGTEEDMRDVTWEAQAYWEYQDANES